MSQASILDRFLDPVTECLSPEVAQRLVELRLDPATQARIEELREKANEGRLSSDERADYEEIVEGMDFIAILKAKARTALARQAS